MLFSAKYRNKFPLNQMYALAEKARKFDKLVYGLMIATGQDYDICRAKAKECLQRSLFATIDNLNLNNIALEILEEQTQ